MEALHSALEALDKESKELISTAQDAACEAVLKHRVLPSHVALALTQRFTPERIAESFPALCLVDALVHLSPAVQVSGPPNTAPVTAQGAAAKAILDVFWKTAPTLFTAFQDVRDEGMRRKSERLVRRWGARKHISSALEKQLIDAMAQRTTAVDADEAPGKSQQAETATTPTGNVTSPAGEGQRVGAAMAPQQAAASSSSVPAAPTMASTAVSSSSSSAALARLALTQQEVDVMMHNVRNCLAILERLPAERAYLYVQLLDEEGSLAPALLPTALQTVQGLWGELQRDEFVLTARGLGSAAAGTGGNGNSAAGTGSTVPPAASAEATAALNQLFARLATSEGGTGPSTTTTAGSNTMTTFSGHALPPALAAPTLPIRYASQILTDTIAVQSLQQRPGGYGPLLPRKLSSGPGGSSYYPRFSSACASRRFRPRVSAAGATVGVARSQRRGFPTMEEWVGTMDSERMALVDDGAEQPTASRKRERE